MSASKNQKHHQLVWQGLSKNDTTILKAIGISMIVLHNYCHLLPGWLIENEFTFTANKFRIFRQSLSLNPFNDAGLLFAYLGHYGVQLFVFLSAYGLYTSYQNKPLHYWKFICERIWKLWPAFFLAALFFLVFTILSTRSFYHPELYFGVLLRLSFVSNFIPGHSLSVVGPWWFYSMIVQFYFVFPLLRKWFNRYGVLLLLFVSLVGWALINLFLYRLSATGIDPMALVIGHLPVFCFGMLLAKYKSRPMPVGIFIVACLVFLLANFYMKAWLFSRVSVIILFLYAYVFLKKTAKPGKGAFRNALLFIGNLSMYLFAVNGFLRAPFLQQTTETSSPGVKCVIFVAFLLFVFLVALLLRFTEKLLFHRFNNRTVLKSRLKAVQESVP